MLLRSSECCESYFIIFRCPLLTLLPAPLQSLKPLRCLPAIWFFPVSHLAIYFLYQSQLQRYFSFHIICSKYAGCFLSHVIVSSQGSEFISSRRTISPQYFQKISSHLESIRLVHLDSQSKINPVIGYRSPHTNTSLVVKGKYNNEQLIVNEQRGKQNISKFTKVNIKNLKNKLKTKKINVYIITCK